MYVRELPPLLEAKKLEPNALSANSIKAWLEGMSSVNSVEIHLVPDPDDEESFCPRLKVDCYLDHKGTGRFWVSPGDYIVAPAEQRNWNQPPVAFTEEMLVERFSVEPKKRARNFLKKLIK